VASGAGALQKRSYNTSHLRRTLLIPAHIQINFLITLTSLAGNLSKCASRRVVAALVSSAGVGVFGVKHVASPCPFEPHTTLRFAKHTGTTRDSSSSAMDCNSGS